MSTFQQDIDDLKNETIAAFRASESEAEKEERILVNGTDGEPSVTLIQDGGEGKVKERGTAPNEFSETAPPPRKQKVNTHQKRLNEYAYKAKLAQEEKEHLALKLQEAARIIDEQNRKLASQEKLNSEYYDYAQKVSEKAILEKLRQAELEGDIDEKIELNEKLTEIKTDRKINEYHQHQAKQRPANFDFPIESDIIEYPVNTGPSIPDYRIEDDPVHEAIRTCLDHNPFLDPHSPTYNPNLAEDFIQEQSKVDAQLSISNETHLIGTAPYFLYIAEQVKSKYMEPQPMVDVPNTNNYQQASRSYAVPPSVAPVSRAGGTMADQYARTNNNYGTRLTLNADQYQAARTLAAMKPHMSEQEVIRNFARSIKEAQNMRDGDKLVIRG
jgi:hypothetical protein